MKNLESGDKAKAATLILLSPNNGLTAAETSHVVISGFALADTNQVWASQAVKYIKFNEF